MANWTEEDLRDMYRRRGQPYVEKIPAAKTRAKAHGQYTPGKMNKTEESFEREVLIPLKSRGGIWQYFFEAITFKIGPDCRYTPDFIVIDILGIISAIEVKGTRKGKMFSADDSKVKVRSCSDKFGMLAVFRWAHRLPNGRWEITNADSSIDPFDISVLYE